jgi:hypothetical protein
MEHNFLKEVIEEINFLVRKNFKSFCDIESCFFDDTCEQVNCFFEKALNNLNQYHLKSIIYKNKVLKTLGNSCYFYYDSNFIMIAIRIQMILVILT